MSSIRRLVLDILKPHDPGMETFAEEINNHENVEAVNLSLIEVDEEVENIKATVEGENIDLDELRSLIDDLGGSIHSVDQIVCGSRMVEQVNTPQD
jgi:hypothetical protein